MPNVPDDKRAITNHHLLTHTSGIGTHYAADGIAERDETVNAIIDLPLKGSIGAFDYSNDGYSLLAAPIEVSTGNSMNIF